MKRSKEKRVGRGGTNEIITSTQSFIDVKFEWNEYKGRSLSISPFFKEIIIFNFVLETS